MCKTKRQRSVQAPPFVSEETSTRLRATRPLSDPVHPADGPLVETLPRRRRGPAQTVVDDGRADGRSLALV